MAREPKPWYRADRRVWTVTINGKRHNLGPIKKDALDRFKALMQQPRREKVVADHVAVVIDEFLDWVKRNRSEATFEWYRWRLQHFIDRHPDLRIHDLKPYHVEKWAGGGDRAKTTRRNLMRSVKRCLKWAVAQGYLESSPIAQLEIPGGQSRDVYIPPEEFARLLTFVPDENLRSLLSVTYSCGSRPQESLRVEARHADLSRSRWVFPASEAKVKDQPRVVYLSEEGVRITEELMRRYPEGPLFRNASGRPWTSDAIGCAFDRLAIRMGTAELTRIGEQISATEIANRIETLAKHRRVRGQVVPKTPADLRAEAKSKLKARRARELAPRYSLYAFRHSWATNALKRGVDALTVAILMGHRDPSTLARTYQHLSHNPEHLLAQARKAINQA
jgi:integrase